MRAAQKLTLRAQLPGLFLGLALAGATCLIVPVSSATLCNSGEPPEEPTPVDIFVVLDRSGSMGSQWDASVTALTAFVNDAESEGTGVAMNFFPASSAPTGETCDEDYYDPPQVPLDILPGAAASIITAMNSVVASGPNTPTYGALYGTYVSATDRQDNEPDRQVVVVLATDGQPNSCPAPQNDTEVIAGLATAAYNYNGVETYVIAIQGSNLVALNTIAAAGNTGQAIDVSSDISAFLAAMETVRNSVLPDEDGDGLFDPDDNCPSVANVGQEDQDADCFGDVCDDDIDGDGTLNASDAFPLDPSEDTDTDSDGLGNNADLDDDGDGLGDWIEVAIGFDPLSTDSNENGTEDGNDLIALVHGCATAVAPALTPSGTGVLLGLMAGFGIAQLIRRRR